jgi:hypothetical protein
MILSLGHACQVKYQLDMLFGKKETHFYDWLVTDFKSVLYVLNNINDDAFLDKSQFTNSNVFYNRDSWVLTNHKIEHINFKMISVHDVLSTCDYVTQMDDFVAKYKRRLLRFKELIQSDDVIHMVCCIDHQYCDGYIMTNDDISTFFNLLYGINNNNKCTLHILLPPPYHELSLDITHPRAFIHKLTIINDIKHNWKNDNYNWADIFNTITSIRID